MAPIAPSDFRQQLKAGVRPLTMGNTSSITVNAAIESARPLFFANEEYPEYPISIGATCFLIAFKGGAFAITAEHTLTGQRRGLHEIRVGLAADSLAWLLLRDVYGFPHGNECGPGT